MKNKNKIEDDFILKFSNMSDTELEINYNTDHARMLDMMKLSPEDMMVLLVKIETYCKVMDERGICHD